MQTNPRVTIVDFGGGNLLSVVRAFQHCHAEIDLTANPKRIAEAERLVLPGVGAFGTVLDDLKARHLIDPIRCFGETERPLLGICVGMQLLFDFSEEFGQHEGFGFIPGKVTRIPSMGSNGTSHKIPHTGWSDLVPPGDDTGWRGTILDRLKPGDSVYFVHSYTAAPEDEEDRLADCYYDGQRISAAVQRGSIIGCQFHPEKSGQIGLTIIENFLAG